MLGFTLVKASYWRNSCGRTISLIEWVNYIVKMKSVSGDGKENGGWE